MRTKLCVLNSASMLLDSDFHDHVKCVPSAVKSQHIQEIKVNWESNKFQLELTLLSERCCSLLKL